MTRASYPKPIGNLDTSLAARRAERAAMWKRQKAALDKAMSEVEEAVKRLKGPNRRVKRIVDERPSDGEASS